ALALKPDYIEALIQAGVMLKVLGRPDEALASYEAAIAARPDHFDAHYYRGDQLATMGRFDEAVAAFDTALKLRPDHPPALFARQHAGAGAARRGGAGGVPLHRRARAAIGERASRVQRARPYARKARSVEHLLCAGAREDRRSSGSASRRRRAASAPRQCRAR